MSELHPLIQDLALTLVVAGIVTIIFKRLRQPLVLGYIMAGFLVSPHMPYTMSIVDRADIQTWADIGVIFLLFSLGLDFSFKKIMKMGISPAIAATTIISSMVVLGIVTGRLFGWTTMDSLFLGGMLAMSSTTIIYKAFDDMGLRQQAFAQMVMSVLILEDILAIVMMVLLSAVAGDDAINGSQLLGSVVSIVFFLVLWFVVGIFAVPLFLRSVRRFITGETLLIVSLGLCCFMAVLSAEVGFSAAFGAFVMGSILAETIEADKIARLVDPVKNLFGAVFFVSVGMLVDPQVLVDYALPIVVITLVIIIGQSVFGSLGYLLSGQPLSQAMRCGFSMAQIGEFAFIIASLGLSLGVISKFLYPVVVAVSVVTTFLTPYMIRLAEPAYKLLERRMPKSLVRNLNRFYHDPSNDGQVSESAKTLWKDLLASMLANTVIYSTLTVAVIIHAPDGSHGHRLAAVGGVRSGGNSPYLAFPAQHNNEEEPQRRVPPSVGRACRQPRAAVLHHRSALRTGRWLRVLCRQQAHQPRSGTAHHHCARGCFGHYGFALAQETQHTTGADVRPEPAFSRHRGTGSWPSSPAL